MSKNANKLYVVRLFLTPARLEAWGTVFEWLRYMGHAKVVESDSTRHVVDLAPPPFQGASGRWGKATGDSAKAWAENNAARICSFGVAARAVELSQ